MKNFLYRVSKTATGVWRWRPRYPSNLTELRDSRVRAQILHSFAADCTMVADKAIIRGRQSEGISPPSLLIPQGCREILSNCRPAFWTLFLTNAVTTPPIAPMRPCVARARSIASAILYRFSPWPQEPVLLRPVPVSGDTRMSGGPPRC